MEQQILPLNGAMNQDLHPKYIRSEEGEVYERNNLRPNSIDGTRWVNRKINGNTLIDKTLPDGNNKVIGWCENMKNDAIIYFIYNDFGNHSIYRYYQKSKIIEYIWFGESQLDFQDTIIKAWVAEDDLYWVNGDNACVKMCNITKSVNYTIWLQTGVINTPRYTEDDRDFSVNIFHMEKKPPRYAPEVVYTTQVYDIFNNGEAINFNNLRKKQFQFKYCYVYDDNQESAWSPISKVPLPENELDINGEWVEDIRTNNAIRVFFDSGSNQVKKIKFAARECTNRAAMGDFFTFREIEITTYAGVRNYIPDTEYETYFLNNSKLANINTEINNRYYDDIPLSGRDTLLLNGQWGTVAMPKVGYDLTDVNYKLDVIRTERDFGVSEIAMTVCQGTCYGYTIARTYITIPTQFYADSTYTISFNYGGTDYFFSLLANDYSVGYPNSMALAFCGVINAGTGHDLFDQVPADLNIIESNHLNIGQAARQLTNVVGLITTTSVVSDAVYKSLKRGQYHPFAIVYNDGYGRYNVAQGKMELFSPWVDCTLAGDKNSTIGCRISIYSAPPPQAETYRLAYVPNKTYSYFLQLAGVKIEEHSTDQNDWQYGIPDGKYLLLINQAIQRIRDQYPNTQIANYIWQNGDRVKGVFNDEHSYEILSELSFVSGQDGEGNDIVESGYLIDHEINYSDCEGLVTTTTTTSASGFNHDSLIEIYRPSVSLASEIFYEIGDEYPVLQDANGNYYHGVPDESSPLFVQAQTFHTDGSLENEAIYDLDFGDVYFRLRGFVDEDLNTSRIIPVEDVNYSDFYTSSGIDLGRVTARIEMEQKILNSLMHGESFIEGSELNRLNVWIPGTTRLDLSSTYGDITGIEEMGGTLKVIQEHVEGSVMIGEVTAKFADMGDWIFLGDTVFGAYRRYPEKRGSTYRRSIISNIRYLYYFDESTSEFIRSSPNGQQAISKEFQMQSWFERKAKELREADPNSYKDVIVSFNNNYEEVWVSFIVNGDIETLVFSEKEGQKGWLFFVYLLAEDYPENFASYKDTQISFYNGQLYLQNEGDPNTFFGINHNSSLKAYVNKFPIVSKRYASLNIASNRNIWQIVFNIPEGLNYMDQLSYLKPAIISQRENMLYSDILRNVKTRAGVIDVTRLRNAERMTGEYMGIQLVETDFDDDQVTLGNISVNFEIAK